MALWATLARVTPAFLLLYLWMLLFLHLLLKVLSLVIDHPLAFIDLLRHLPRLIFHNIFWHVIIFWFWQLDWVLSDSDGSFECSISSLFKILPRWCAPTFTWMVQMSLSIVHHDALSDSLLYFNWLYDNLTRAIATIWPIVLIHVTFHLFKNLI